MARYYFDVQENGETRSDAEGIELPDLDAAAREAADAVVEMARDYRVASGSREISIEVSDSGGHRVLKVAMALRVVPEIRH
jgi:Domain of unknown function (DUF6894)